MLSIGFYKNPYRQWENALYRHIFAFDEVCNLYVGQYSVYHKHMEKICDLKDQHENGILHQAGSRVPPSGVKELNNSEGCDFIHKILPIAEFKNIESTDIIYLNKRLKKIAQRLYDYGMPEDTILFSKEVDLWNPRINQILGDSLIRDRPTESSILANL